MIRGAGSGNQEIEPQSEVLCQELDADQQQIVRGNFEGPVLLLGGAGTGKTLIALHRAVWLASNVFTRHDERILVTTSSRSLTEQNSKLLSRICPSITNDRINVQTLAKVAMEVLKLSGIKIEWDWQSTKTHGREALEYLLNEACNESNSSVHLPEKELLDEFFLVVVRRKITTKATYLRETHSSFDKSIRENSWLIFRKFRSILAGNGNVKKMSRRDGFALAARLCDYLNDLPYVSVIVDETHDLDEPTLRFIAAISGNNSESFVPNSLFLAADPLQRTYEGDCPFEVCGIRSEKQVYRLNRNYRNSGTVAGAASADIHALLASPNRGRYDSREVPIAVRAGGVPCNEFRPAALTDLVEYVEGTIRSWQRRTGHVAANADLSDYAVICSTKELAREICRQLEMRGFPSELQIGYDLCRSSAERCAEKRLQIRTIYTAKGLSYIGVIAVFDDRVKNASSLLYVAKTRAQDLLSIVRVDGCALMHGTFVKPACVQVSADASNVASCDGDCDTGGLGGEQISEHDRYVKLGLCSFDIDRYRDSICYYCMPHDPASEKEYMETRKPPFPISDTFRSRVRLVLQTPAPVLCLEHPDLRDLPARGHDLIQTIQHGFKYWRDKAEDEEIAAKAKYVVEKIDELGCEMGVAGNFPSVADYVIDVLDYAAGVRFYDRFALSS